MNCMNCGGPMSAGVRFCPRCGTPAASPMPPPAQQPYVPPSGQMQTSWNVGQQQFGPPPRRKSRLGKFLLIALGILLVIGIGAGFAVYYGYKYLESSLKNSEPYGLAVEELKRSPAAAERLGAINGTGFPLGSFNESAGGSGNAAFTMSVDGTKADGHYVVTMDRKGGAWSVTNAYLRLADGEIVNLTDADRPAGIGNTGGPGLNENAAPRPNNVRGAAVSGGLLNERAIEKPAPPYPQVARAARASGTVTVQVTVDEQGRVVDAKAVSGHPLLQAAAVAAARQARFRPTLLSGKPVKVTGTLTYDFKLE